MLIAGFTNFRNKCLRQYNVVVATLLNWLLNAKLGNILHVYYSRGFLDVSASPSVFRFRPNDIFPRPAVGGGA